MTTPVLWVVVLVAAGAYDFAITRYVVAVEAKQGLRAGLWSVATYLVGLVGTASILKVSPWLVVPECLGLLAGTLLGVALRRS